MNYFFVGGCIFIYSILSVRVPSLSNKLYRFSHSSSTSSSFTPQQLSELKENIQSVENDLTRNTLEAEGDQREKQKFEHQ